MVLQPLGKHVVGPEPKNVWMVYSDSSIMPRLDELFVSVRDTFEHHWPYTFAHLKPVGGSATA